MLEVTKSQEKLKSDILLKEREISYIETSNDSSKTLKYLKKSLVDGSKKSDKHKSSLTGRIHNLKLEQLELHKNLNFLKYELSSLQKDNQEKKEELFKLNNYYKELELNNNNNNNNNNKYNNNNNNNISSNLSRSSIPSLLSSINKSVLKINIGSDNNSKREYHSLYFRNLFCTKKY